jgi:energy-converting hydrogenase Eha subunit B
MFTSRDILPGEGSLEQLQRSERLIEGHFMTGLVDTYEAVKIALTDLAMYDAVGGCNVDEAGVLVAACVDFFGNNLAAEPVAVVIADPRISQS